MTKPSPNDCVPMMMGPESAAQVCADTPAGLNLLQVFQDKSPAVVQLVVTKENGPSKSSGFFVTSDGKIATEYHNVRESSKISIITADKQVLDAHVTAKDPAAGVAILSVDNPRNKQFPTLTLTDDLSVGDTVFGFGHPFGTDDIVTAPGLVQEKTTLGELNVKEGIPKDEDLSHKMYVAEMQTAKGFSGGPVFKLDGTVPGIIAFGGGHASTGIVPSSYIKDLLGQSQSR